jgi:hypothetical protein
MEDSWGDFMDRGDPYGATCIEGTGGTNVYEDIPLVTLSALPSQSHLELLSVLSSPSFNLSASATDVSSEVYPIDYADNPDESDIMIAEPVDENDYKPVDDKSVDHDYKLRDHPRRQVDKKRTLTDEMISNGITVTEKRRYNRPPRSNKQVKGSNPLKVTSTTKPLTGWVKPRIHLKFQFTLIKCIHRNFRLYCEYCSNTNGKICSHRVNRNYCLHCSCEHYKPKNKCKQCKEITCDHDRPRVGCDDCDSQLHEDRLKCGPGVYDHLYNKTT